MPILERYLQDESLATLFHNYWQMDNRLKFIYSISSLLKNQNIKTESSLNKLIQQAGIVILKGDQYRCKKCGKQRLWHTRKEISHAIKILQRNETLEFPCCRKCQEEYLINDTKTILNRLYPYFQQYDYVYELNTNKTLDINKILQSLNFLELIYLYVIHSEVKTTYPGKLGPLVFPRFMHEEFHKKNKVLQSLMSKKLLAHTVGESIYEDLSNLSFNYKEYKALLSNKELDDQCKMYEKYPIFRKFNQSFLHLIFLPRGYSSTHFSKVILEYIDNYILSFKDIEYLNDFLQKKRNNEIVHLVNTTYYNNKFRLKGDLLSVKERFIQLKNKYNLKQIYAHLENAIYMASYVLDYHSSSQHFYLKNQIFTNSFISKKNNPAYNKMLPKNLRKSYLITFLEERYNLQDQWFDLPINDFMKQLIQAINNSNTHTKSS